MVRNALLLIGSLLVASAVPAQVPPRDQPPAHVDAARLEAQLKAQIAAEGLTVERAVTLARYQRQRGAAAEAEATLLDARKTFPIDRDLAIAIAQHYVGGGKAAQATAVLDEQARLTPDDASLHRAIATYYEELLRKGTALSDDDKRAYARNAVAAIDRALAIDATSVDALVFKALLLRHQANLEPDAALQRTLISEADALRARAVELRQPQAARGTGSAGTLNAPAPPPPPTRPPCAHDPAATIGQAPVRVGGNIQPPAKVKDVRPEYPSEAHAAGIQGVVIIEATIDEAGRVAQACVLRSIPGLDDPALDAVRQWVFTPTLLNGAPVPVIMTVTVNFTLQQF